MRVFGAMSDGKMRAGGVRLWNESDRDLGGAHGPFVGLGLRFGRWVHCKYTVCRIRVCNNSVLGLDAPSRSRNDLILLLSGW